jgi:hypothetical protein
VQVLRSIVHSQLSVKLQQAMSPARPCRQGFGR